MHSEYLSGHAAGNQMNKIIMQGRQVAGEVDAARELGVPAVLLWTASACGYMGV